MPRRTHPYARPARPGREGEQAVVELRAHMDEIGSSLRCQRQKLDTLTCRL